MSNYFTLDVEWIVALSLIAKLLVWFCTTATILTKVFCVLIQPFIVQATNILAMCCRLVQAHPLVDLR